MDFVIGAFEEKAFDTATKAKTAKAAREKEMEAAREAEIALRHGLPWRARRLYGT